TPGRREAALLLVGGAAAEQRNKRRRAGSKGQPCPPRPRMEEVMEERGDSRADLVRHLGVPGGRVTQVLSVLGPGSGSVGAAGTAIWSGHGVGAGLEGAEDVASGAPT